MTAKVFLDTNLLVYAAAGTGKEQAKQRAAMALIDSEDFATSAQVLQEFFVTVTRKIPKRLSREEALEWIDLLTAFPCQAIDHRLVRIAIEQSAKYRISYWDAAVISAAQTQGCEVLYSEDLNDGQIYGGVKVVNPLPK